MTSLFLKSLVGALAVLLIAILARSKSVYLAGLVPLFPTFALIAHVIIGTERSAADLQHTALFGLWSLVPYAGYLGVVWFGSTRWSLPVTLGTATAAWVLLALGMILLWERVRPPING